jgi:pyridoxal phosphate enzyme (YggS family)
MDEIGARLERIRVRIQDAAARSNRDAQQIRIVAVTKTHPAETVRLGYQAGLRVFGENRVEEALAKQADVPALEGLEWHMVGHVQSRKAKHIPASFSLLHSLDRSKLAHRLNRRAGELGLRLPVLLECNVSGEASKQGWQLLARPSWEEVVDEFSEIRLLPNLEVRGLMTMAPITQDPETVRPVFRRLRELRDFLIEAVPGNWSELSMGMTDDFEIAVEEGATLLRIGRALFGERQRA